MKWSVSRILPIVLFFSIGFMSCQEEEVIPLETADVVEEDDIATSGLEVQISDPVLVDEKLEQNDKNLKGKVIGNYYGAPIATFHDNRNFGGKKAIYRTGDISSPSIGVVTGSSNIDANTGAPNSMSIAPGCNVKIYDSNNGVRTFNNRYNRKGRYVSYMATSPVRFSYTCYTHVAKQGNLCAVADVSEGANIYSSSKRGLPLYYNTPISFNELNSWGWNDKIESISFMAGSRCKNLGVTFTEHTYDKNYHIFENQKKITIKSATNVAKNLSSFSPNLKRRASSIIPAGDYQLRESDHLHRRAEGESYWDGYFGEVDWRRIPASTRRDHCEMVEDQCNINYVTGGSEALTFLGTMGCPLAGLATQSVAILGDFEERNWKNLGIDLGIGLLDALVTAGESVVIPEAEAAACVMVATGMAGKVGSEAQCYVLKQDCLESYGL